MFGMKMSPIKTLDSLDRCQSHLGVQKRRAKPTFAEQASGIRAPGVASSMDPFARVANPAQVAGIKELVENLKVSGAQVESRLRAVAELRRMMSIGACPPIQAVIDEGACTPLVACLDDNSSAVQFEAAWTITNIASGTTAQTSALLEVGAAEALFRILASGQICGRADLCDQCLCALSNIAGDDDVQPRDQLLARGVIGHLGSLFERIPNFTWDLHGRVQVLRSLTRLMSNLCCGHPAPPLDEVDCAFDYFVQVLLGTEDTEMLADALFGLCCLIEGATDDKDGARAVRMMSAGFAPDTPPPMPHPTLLKAVDCFKWGGRVSSAALHLLGLLVSMPEDQLTDSVISAGALQGYRTALLDGHLTQKMHSDAAWALSNIAAGTSAQAQCLLDTRGVFDALCRTVETGLSAEVKHECAWAVAHMARRGSQTLTQLDARRLLSALAQALKVESDIPLLCALLDSSEAVLQFGQEQAAAKGQAKNALAAHAEELGLPQQLERLQRSQEQAVYRRAAHVLDTLSDVSANQENEPPKEKTPKKDRMARTPSAICGGSPIRPAAFKFGA
mmetsp:Transcript_73626/g.216009  ORF Transcript_73626/g.216009 Transcript_73626/m.216009 type:complete len:562 (+) Transcript_73626:101-1786(+)